MSKGAIKIYWKMCLLQQPNVNQVKESRRVPQGGQGVYQIGKGGGGDGALIVSDAGKN